MNKLKSMLRDGALMSERSGASQTARVVKQKKTLKNTVKRVMSAKKATKSLVSRRITPSKTKSRKVTSAKRTNIRKIQKKTKSRASK
ncbi:hypothetical protein Ciccas_006384 [Cichlidogyrus casuarinus]|uniref:30S ribosomal protein S20 n=1 Tax=Cichlidogyrus casuarinus TaxID=1844966 RepID=A0ABD2Q6B6_9PLAT